MTDSSKIKRFYRDIANDCYKCEGDFIICNIDSTRNCTYKKLKSSYDPGNFVKHLRNVHPEKALEYGLLKQGYAPEKKRKILKTSIALDRQAVVESLVKMVSLHHLPLCAVEWEGFRELLDPICEALKFKINRDNISRHIEQCAVNIREKIAAEMQGRLICIKVDSASRYGRHVVGINAQYNKDDTVIIRTLAMMEVKCRQTGKFLKSKIDDVLKMYGVAQEQLFSVTCDNGANMIAAVREMQKDAVAFIDEEADADDVLSDQSMLEYEKEISLVRCAVHTMQLAVHDVVKTYDSSIREIAKVAVTCRQIIYKSSFEIHKTPLPPLFSRTRWGGVYIMLEHFKTHELFYREMGSSYNVLDLDSHWEFICHYVEAFEPIFRCTKEMQSKHVSLSCFYIQWLKAIMEVKKIASNALTTKLVSALTVRLSGLKTSMVFKACMLLDPRLNYLNSNILTVEDKLETRQFLIATNDRLSKIRKIEMKNESKSTETIESDEFDTFLTEMLGGGLPNTNCSSVTLHQQLNALDLEPHQSYSFDVWKYQWNERLVR
ncbi:uncharacterized protein LOC131433787 [Malaya genurostris]|uniref:uncharacterized protein LOC131429189 n=1 Tax=Malaya genurostris TaxID=325434 RepID=UPI0026F402FB|nr:uncharacterized protein LOC131429189 [Malaya genurostris]XP_058456367.1 uncharacterized protein LOC131433787 [Malaya genurostris]